MEFNNEYINEVLAILVPATIDTIYMVFLSSFFSLIFGLLLGIILYITDEDGLVKHPLITIINKILSFIVNILRSIPFVIIIIALFPLSRLIVGTTIGRTAAIVPLTIAAIPFVARLTQSAFCELDKGVIEVSIGAGATTFQTITRVILPESAPSLVNCATITVINLVGYSAMAGMIGSGGLGFVAQKYGLVGHRPDVLFFTIVILVIIVQVIQQIGNLIFKSLDKR